MTADDLLMARRWLETPEVRRWWGDPDEQLALLTEDLGKPRMRMWIVSHGGRPFAYIQDYDPLSWSLHHFDAAGELGEVSGVGWAFRTERISA
jgi:aminoglycoside 6'-N-acetyltransferase